MRRKKQKGRPASPRPQRWAGPTVAQYDFGSMLPFLREHLPEHHPIYMAALANDLVAFMAALRDLGDGQLNHDIAGELARISRSADGF